MSCDILPRARSPGARRAELGAEVAGSGAAAGVEGVWRGVLSTPAACEPKRSAPYFPRPVNSHMPRASTQRASILSQIWRAVLGDPG